MKHLLDPSQILEILSESPAKIVEATADLSDTDLANHPVENEWSPLEILAHLRACADVWGDVHIVGMLEEDEPTMRAVNPMRWIRGTDYYVTPFSASLAAFRDQRSVLLVRIGSISAFAWERGATFTGGGPPRRYTVHSEADAIARHERAHIKQIAKRCALIREGTKPM
jgi:hypothetical protein